jgi:hypothetical protein
MSQYYTSIRFGIMCDGSTLASWERQVVDRLLATPNVSLQLLIIEGHAAGKPQSLASRVARVNSKRLLFTAYSKLLYKPTAIRRTSIADLVACTPARTCVVELKGKFSQYFSEADITAVANYKLDFILRFGFNIIRGKMLTTPRFGVWSFHHDDEMRYRGAPPCFWEIYNNDPVTGAILQRLTDKLDGGVVLKKGYFRTKSYSYSRTIDMVYEESAHWPAAICQQLQLDSTQLDFTTATRTDAPIYYPPTNTQFLVFAAKVLRNKVRKAYETYLRAEEWNIGVVAQPIHHFLKPEHLRNVAIDTAVLPNRTTFFADSFGRPESDGTWIYFEAFDYRTNHGNISRLRYPWQAGTSAEVVMDFPFHLSYPYLFNEYCLPESAAANQIALYDLNQAHQQPASAALLGLDVLGVDPTVIEHDGLFWLFYTRQDRDPDLNLYLAYAEQLAGPWHQHPQNPIKTDVRSARPAGTPVWYNNRWYRPAQNFSQGYGSGIVINEILTLSPTVYAEQMAIDLTSMHPNYPDGMHTMARIDDQHTVIDFKRYRFIPVATWTRLRTMLGR